jgi:hypothetical protein
MRFPPVVFLFLSFFLLQVSSGSVETASGTGIRMTVQIGFDTGNKYESQYTSYTATDRKRMEYHNATGGGLHADGTLDMRPGPRLASITRCDLGQAFELNLEDGEYEVMPYPQLTKIAMATGDLSVLRKTDSAAPTVRIETTTVDTGERTELFGHLARHVITTRKQTPLAGSRAKPQETVTDGWYIDLDTSITCDVEWPGGQGSHAHLRSGPALEKYEFVDKGHAETGLAVERKMRSRRTLTTSGGTKTETTYSSELKIIEFTEGRLDPALFEIPPGFRKVEDINRNPPLTLADRWFYTQAWIRAMARSVFK